MVKKLIAIVIIFFNYSCDFFNEEKGTYGIVKGTVIDKHTNIPIEDCKVITEYSLSYQPDSYNYINGPYESTTDANGKFKKNWGEITRHDNIWLHLVFSKTNYASKDTIIFKLAKFDKKNIVNLGYIYLFKSNN